MSIRDKLLKNSTIKKTSLIKKSEVYGNKSLTKTFVPIINLASSGKFDGGLITGMSQIAGPSRHFKTMFGLVFVKSFLDANPDGSVMFYDSEFGTSLATFESMGIDMDRVIHVPITNIEELKVDVAKQVFQITREDKVMFFIDSVGNLASIKEVTDALNEDVKTDMTRAKELKSFTRIITPHLVINDIPMVIINHTYDTMEMYSKKIVSGGTGLMLSSDTVWIIGKRQDKEGKELVGNDFVINIEKSRFIREKSQFTVNVSFEEGIKKYSGLWDLALEVGVIEARAKGWYNLKGGTGKNFQRGEVEDNELFWEGIFDTTDFKQLVEEKYKLGSVSLIGTENDVEEDPYAPIEEYED
jgi:RecA/RadA recombinase